MAHTPSHRGVSYGVPVDRLTGGSVPVVKTTSPDDDYAKQLEAQNAAAIADFKTNASANMKSLLGLFGGGGQKMSASDSLARDRFNYERSQDAAGAKKQSDILAAYQQLLSGGGFRSGQDKLIEMMRGQAGTSGENVRGLYGETMGNIGAGYGDAQRLQDAGYSALQQYLNQNPNNPYANVAVSAGPTQDDLSGLLGAYGVSADPVRAQVAAEGAAAQQGAAGFQSLLDVLGASAQQSDASRLAEMMMSQNFANTSLGSQKAGFESQASRAQQDALAQIQAQLAQGEMQQEQSAASRFQEIQDAVIAAGGKLPEEGETEETAPAAPAAKQKPIDALKTRMETASPSLKKKIEKFVAANPKAGKKKIEQAFPKIASKMK
jgi:hypothetical protein